MKTSGHSEIELRPNESIDRFMDGRIRLVQSRAGYRFSIDAILLSEFVTIKKGDVVADLGTGCGIIPLVLLLKRPVSHAIALEVQGELADQAVRNAALNDYSNKMSVILGDLRYPPLSASSVDVVVCNPPYRKKDSGRINPDQQRAIARHEILVSLDDILDTSRHLLRARGRFAMIYPAERLVDLMVRMTGKGLEPKKVRIIYPNLESEAKLALVEACPGGRRGVKILPPLLDQGRYSF
ncbi:MAG: methyltransferase [Deltaproteobacteria bacterium]|nr:methyltransferase [Deltaproteobacteria bacterium]